MKEDVAVLGWLKLELLNWIVCEIEIRDTQTCIQLMLGIGPTEWKPDKFLPFANN